MSQPITQPEPAGRIDLLLNTPRFYTDGEPYDGPVTWHTAALVVDGVTIVCRAVTITLAVPGYHDNPGVLVVTAHDIYDHDTETYRTRVWQPSRFTSYDPHQGVTSTP